MKDFGCFRGLLCMGCGVTKNLGIHTIVLSAFSAWVVGLLKIEAYTRGGITDTAPPCSVKIGRDCYTQCSFPESLPQFPIECTQALVVLHSY
jgi:hypothetical protein